MNKEAADDFIEWFSKNFNNLTEVHEAMNKGTGDAPDTELIFGKFQELAAEIAPRLDRIHQDLLFELGPSDEKPYGLVLSAGGLAELIPAVKYLAEGLKDNPSWEVIAFKPAREISEEARQLIPTNRGEIKVGVRDVTVSLHPEPLKIGVRLYFKNFDDAPFNLWAEVGFNFLDFTLGEYVVIENLGEIDFLPQQEAPSEAFPLLELQANFTKALIRLREEYQELRDLTPAERIKHNLNNIKADLSEVQQAINSRKAKRVFLDIELWAHNESDAAAAAEVFEGFDIAIEPLITSVGTGKNVTVSGELSIESCSVREALAERLSSGFTDFVIYSLQEQETVSPGLAEYAASNLISTGNPGRAVRLLNGTLRVYSTEIEDGTLYGLLALAYLDLEDYQKALNAYENALGKPNDKIYKGELLNNKAIALQNLGRLEEAVTHFEEALELGRELPSRHYNLGQAYGRKNESEKACAHLSTAIELDSAMIEYLHSDSDLDPIRNTAPFKELVEKFSN